MKANQTAARTVHASRPRAFTLSLLLMLSTMAGGLIIRFAPLGLPSALMKYGGSTLWALMLYWSVSTVYSSWATSRLVCMAGVLATTVELVKLYRSPWLDAFRLTLPGALLLGRFFSVWDLVAYWSAIMIGALLDQSINRAECVD